MSLLWVKRVIVMSTVLKVPCKAWTCHSIALPFLTFSIGVSFELLKGEASKIGTKDPRIYHS